MVKKTKHEIGLGCVGVLSGCIPFSIMENQTEKKMENEMETGMRRGSRELLFPQ